MNWKVIPSLIAMLAFHVVAKAQKILPEITVQNFGGKIIVSWQNEFNKPVSDIFIQRSYDSLKNYSTIGTILNPQNKENGYSDIAPPYTKMYYRVSISFENGEYLISAPVRPVKETTPENDIAHRYPWLAMTSPDSNGVIRPKKDETTYPSERVFTSRENNVVLFLKDAPGKKYSLKFYDDKDSLLFELTKLREEHLILEKVNFVRSGWFHFELFDDGKLVEKNKFLLSKDTKLN